MKQIRQFVIDFLWMIPFFWVLSTVFVVNNQLANGVVSGKYFWFYVSMGIFTLSTLVFACCRKTGFRFTVFDFMILLFAGSILFSSFVINNASQNTTKIVLLVLLVVLYFNSRLFFENKDTKIIKALG